MPDEIDEPDLPRPGRPRRPCATGCGRPVRPRGRLCSACATAAWRAGHPEAVRRADESRLFNDAQQLLRRARGYVSACLRRGTMQRGACAVCRAPETVPTWADPRVPRAVRWLCAEHRGDDQAVARSTQLSRELLLTQFAELAVQVRSLPLEVRRRLHTAGLQGPTGGGAAAGSMWYWWTVRREYWRWQAEQSGVTTLA